MIVDARVGSVQNMGKSLTGRGVFNTHQIISGAGGTIPDRRITHISPHPQGWHSQRPGTTIRHQQIRILNGYTTCVDGRQCAFLVLGLANLGPERIGTYHAHFTHVNGTRNLDAPFKESWTSAHTWDRLRNSRIKKGVRVTNPNPGGAIPLPSNKRVKVREKRVSLNQPGKVEVGLHWLSRKALLEKLSIVLSVAQRNGTKAPKARMTWGWELIRSKRLVRIPRMSQTEVNDRYITRGDELRRSAKSASKIESCWRPTDSSVERRMG